MTHMHRQSRHLLQAILQTARNAAAQSNIAQWQHHNRYLPSISSICAHAQFSTSTTNTCCSTFSSKLCSTTVVPYYALHYLQCRGFAAQTQARPHNRALKTGLQKAAPSGTQALYLIAFTVAMIGVTYASVPLYRMFCQATGYGGTVQQGSTVEEKLKAREATYNADMEAAAAARDLTVHFNADVSDSLQWKFFPTQRSVQIKPGESTLAFYTAQNNSDKAITGVSTYNVTPQQAGVYFNKIQCFCFEEQKLRPGEKIDMPVFFYVDPEFATDPKLRSVNQLTLSYTFFKISEEEDDNEDEAA